MPHHPKTSAATIHRLLIDAYPGAAFRFELDSHGRHHMVHLNAACARLWELDSPGLMTCPEVFWRMFTPQDLADFRASLDASAHALTDWSREWCITTPSGQRKWLHGVARPERVGVACVGWNFFLTEVTCSRRTEAAARENDARFRQMLDGISNVSVQGYGLDLTTRYWNKASEQLYGFTAREAIGRNLIDLIIPEGMRTQVLDAVVKMVRTGDPIPATELVLQRKDGSPIEVFSSHAYVHIPDGDPMLYCIDIDLTAIRAAHAQRADLETQLRAAQKREALGRLADGVAHDFNSIVTAIQGNVELALDDLPAAHPARTSVAEIHKAGQRARALLNQIFAFSHHRPTQRRASKLQPIVEHAAHLVTASLPEGIRMRTTCAPDAPLVLVDEDQMRQVLLNFCANAWQSIPQGQRGQIALALDRFEGSPPRSPLSWAAPRGTSAAPCQCWARLRVSDNGAGMDPGTRERIFDPFFTTKRPGRGAGLGLTVVHTILAEHGAMLNMHSTPGKGSVFTIYLPAITAEAGPPPAKPRSGPSVPDWPSPIGAKPSQAIARRLHIMLVNDDELITHLMQRLLEKRGYRVSVFCDAKEALRAFCRQSEHFDLVISDHDMRGLSGLEFACAVKARSPTTPVAIASACFPEPVRHRAQQAGIHELIEKPDSAEELFTAIDRLATSCARTERGPTTAQQATHQAVPVL